MLEKKKKSRPRQISVVFVVWKLISKMWLFSPSARCSVPFEHFALCRAFNLIQTDLFLSVEQLHFQQRKTKSWYDSILSFMHERDDTLFIRCTDWLDFNIFFPSSPSFDKHVQLLHCMHIYTHFSLECQSRLDRFQWRQTKKSLPSFCLLSPVCLFDLLFVPKWNENITLPDCTDKLMSVFMLVNVRQLFIDLRAN